MTNLKKLLMFAATGLLAPAAANAEVGTAKVSVAIHSPLNDKAPVSGTPARLRRTDEEQPGAEMAHLSMFADGKKGLYVLMSTEINGQPAPDRVQLGVIPFSLVQGTDGSVSAQPDMTKARFATNNNGNEYRNANHPSAYPIMDGKLMAVRYNYQPNNTNNTEAYLQIFDENGATVMPQTRIMRKNNDDCGMQQDDNNMALVQSSPTSALLVETEGCNGNGTDDGWLNAVTINCTASTTAVSGFASCTAQKKFDLSVVPREERSHAGVSIGTDPNTAIMTWTEGNTQPQRDGTWVAAINIGQGQNGENAQSRLLWKKQIDGRKTIDGITTYSMRAKQSRIMAVDSATGKLKPTDMLIWQSGDLRGNNNTNNGKGGTYYYNQMAVIEATATGMRFVTPLHDVSQDLVGLDGTHLGMQFAMFGTTNAMTPGIMLLGGSHTGGGAAAQARAVTWDQATGKFADGGMFDIAPYDRHLYPNYLGNNPGNQGRNYSDMHFVANPYMGMNGNKDAYLMLFATTGKDPSEMTKPEIKLTGYISVLPVVTAPITPPSGNGSGSDTTPPPSGGGTDPNDNGGTTDPSGSALGGCSATHGSAGAMSFLLIGLAAFIRRRR